MAEHKRKKIKSIISNGRALISSRAWVLSLLLHILILALLAILGFQGSRGMGDQSQGVTIYDSSSGDGFAEEQGEEVEYEMKTLGSISTQFLDTPAQIDTTELVSDIDIAVDGETEPIELTSSSSASLSSQISGQEWQEYVGDAASGAASGSGKAGGSFFGIRDSGQKLVYVVDCSSSMTGERMEAAKTELIRSIKNLPNACSFSVIFYNNDTKIFDEHKLFKAEKKNVNRCVRWIKSVNPAGSTNPMPAIKLAVALEPDCVWLLSDGEFDACVIEYINRMSRRKVRFNTIAFMNEEGGDILEKISDMTGGRYRYVRSATEREPRRIK